MAQTKDLSGANTLDDFGMNLNIEDTQEYQSNDLESFLDNGETDSTDTQSASPIAPPKNKPKPKVDPKPVDSTTPSKEELEKQKVDKEVNNSFDSLLDDEDEVKPSKDSKENITDDLDADSGDDADENEIQAIAKELYRIKFFTKESDEEKIPSTAQEIIEKLEDEKQKGAEDIIYNRIDELAGIHGEEYHSALERLFIDGVPPREYLAQFEKIQDYKTLDMTIESNQIKVVENGLRASDMDEADIKEEVKKLQQNSDLETTSLRYQKALIKREEAGLKQIEERAVLQEEASKKADALYFNNLNAILSKAVKDTNINGIPVSQELAKKAFQLAYVKKYKLPKSKEEITDLDRIFLESKKPENHELRTQLALLFAPTFEGWDKGKKLTIDLSNIQKKAISNESSELFNSVLKNRRQGNTSKTTKSEKYSF